MKNFIVHYNNKKSLKLIQEFRLKKKLNMVSRLTPTTDDPEAAATTNTTSFTDISVTKPPKNTHGIFHLKSIADTFNSYATKKTIATGFFNIALVNKQFEITFFWFFDILNFFLKVTTNFQQMKFLITRNIWVPLNIVVMSFIGTSLLCQFVVALTLVIVAKESEFIDEDKRNSLIRKNNFLTLLVLFITILNIFINVFLAI